MTPALIMRNMPRNPEKKDFVLDLLLCGGNRKKMTHSSASAERTTSKDE